jgi:hypothetical protein
MRIARCQPCDEIASKGRHRSRLRDPEENPRPFAMALDKPGFDEEFEMAGYARLRLAENGDEFANGQFCLGDEGEQPQTRRFTCRGGGGENGIESYGIGHEFPAKIICPNNMQIYLYVKLFSMPTRGRVTASVFPPLRNPGERVKAPGTTKHTPKDGMP